MMGKTSLHIQDIHVAKPYQRLGLGRNLLILMELIARREKIKTISIPIQLKHQNAVNWIGSVGRGYAPDESLLQLLGFDSTLSVSPTLTRLPLYSNLHLPSYSL
jgi:GNAT superfamily N-acetyltransferase